MVKLMKMDESEAGRACPWTDLTPDGEGLIVHDFLTTRLSTLMSALRRKLTHAYTAPFGLSVSEWRVLSLIAHADVLPFGLLVEQSTSDKALVSRTVRLLEERNLIEVRPESDTARKKLACAITAEGRALYEEIMPVAQRRQTEVLSALDTAEREALFAAIEKLQAELDAQRS